MTWVMTKLLAPASGGRRVGWALRRLARTAPATPPSGSVGMRRGVHVVEMATAMKPDLASLIRLLLALLSAAWLAPAPALAQIAFRAAADSSTPPIAFRAATQAGVASGVTTLTISVPAGTITDDVMIAAIAVRPSGVTITAPAGSDHPLGARVDSLERHAHPRARPSRSRRARSSARSSEAAARHTRCGEAAEPSTFTTVASTSLALRRVSKSSARSAWVRQQPPARHGAQTSRCRRRPSGWRASTTSPKRGRARSTLASTTVAPSFSAGSMQVPDTRILTLGKAPSRSRATASKAGSSQLTPPTLAIPG